MKALSEGSDCRCKCVVRPLSRSACRRIEEGSASAQDFYTVETITSGPECKCACIAPPSAVNPCEGEYRLKKLREAGNEDVKVKFPPDHLSCQSLPAGVHAPATSDCWFVDPPGPLVAWMSDIYQFPKRIINILPQPEFEWTGDVPTSCILCYEFFNLDGIHLIIFCCCCFSCPPYLSCWRDPSMAWIYWSCTPLPTSSLIAWITSKR